MNEAPMERLTVEGTEVALRLAGDRTKPALLLLHGFPNSSAGFRGLMAPLAHDAFVVAPDLPGYGESPPIRPASFARLADTMDGLLRQLGIDAFCLYLHDYGAAVGLHLATRSPGRIRGLIVQNANAHASGMGPAWSATRAYWQDPSPEREAQATAHLTLEGTRQQYVGGLPDEVAARIDPQQWARDWRTMCQPGRLAAQRELVLDYREHVARFPDIADYLARWQPPALMLWGRHDAFFELQETLSWMQALPRMEAHVLDGPHLLLETHAAECAALMRGFLQRTAARSAPLTAGRSGSG